MPFVPKNVGKALISLKI